MRIDKVGSVASEGARRRVEELAADEADGLGRAVQAVHPAIENAGREDEMILTGVGGSCAAFDRIEEGGLYAATYLYSPTMAGSAVNMARLIALGEGFSDLIEPEVPSRIVVPPSEVTPDNVDDLRDLCFECRCVRSLGPVRIVAGELRGRRLVAPAGDATRPTTDKVREAVFNALGSLDVVVDARVADLYAGSGALGFEALSRGAVHCTFVERDRAALSAIEENRAALGVRDRTRVKNGDPVTMAASIEADLVFADPPYGFDDWRRLLAALPATASFVVAEAADEVAPPPGWEAARAKRYGRTWVTFLARG